jgi:hypothetical protein
VGGRKQHGGGGGGGVHEEIGIGAAVTRRNISGQLHFFKMS